MQQPPRLVRSKGSGAVQRGAAPASVPVPPLTPRKKVEELNDLIRSIEDRYQLGFNVKAELRSPAQHRSTVDVAFQRIKHLFFSHRPALDDALATFATTVAFIAKDKQAEALLTILRSKTLHASPTSKSGTPTSAKNVPSTSLRTSQLSVEDTPRSRGLFDNYRQNGAAHSYTDDPGSATEEDENDFVTPPSPRAISRSQSPSVTSMSAKRRVEASAHLSLPGTARKRPSDGSDDNRKSSKLTKTSKGKQTSFKPSVKASSKHVPSEFKKPSLDMARSFNGFPTSQSTVNTSFNTVSSSQQTVPDTANTSFTSDADHTEAPQPFSKRTSSTTIGSLDDQDLLTVGGKLENRALTLEVCPDPSNSPSQGCDSSSAWGSSLPEEDMLDASDRVESSHATTSFGRREISPRRSVQQIGGSQRTRSPVKNSVFANAKFEAAALNRSLPPPPGVNSKLSPDKAASKRGSPASGVTPNRAQRQPREQTPIESPSKIAHHIRDIPSQGLFVKEPELDLRAMPYFALFICQRIALEHSVPLTELVHDMDLRGASAGDHRIAFWSSLLKHPKIAHIKYKESDRLWSAAQHNYDGFTFKGQINLRSKRSGSIFQLDLHPVLADKSCRFQRKFGADRFLYLNVPELDKVWAGGTQEDLKHIRNRWDEWLHTEHTFLYRKWRVFHIEPIKKPKTKGRSSEPIHRTRIVLFATEGCHISQKYTVGEMLDWFLPFRQNLNQSFCKAFARFDLGLSRTTPTLIFKPSQILRIRDTLANGDSEAIEFNDPRLRWGQAPIELVMNDGCSVMSVGAALEIWKLCKKFWGIDGPLPSAFQGRIGGAKGLWMISAESHTKDPEHLAIWIKISDSQLKFDPHPEDLSDATCDPIRLTFEVSNCSQTPSQSELHISFIPIMTDRGIPRGTIANYMTERLEAARSDLLEKVKDPVKLYEYVHKNGSTSREGSDMAWQAAMPVTHENKIKLLLESGFSPLELEILAKSVSRFVKKQHRLQESKLKTPLGKATFLYGVADPCGVLKPGEVHIQFSSSFVDNVTDEKYLNLKGHNILVARHPAIRNSDMQKVRGTVHPELSHLVDLVVFPSKGQTPLAGKLQGGDYDGDIFWLCWEDRLVEPFRNAPAPAESPDPERYGIRVNREKLQDLHLDVQDQSSVDRFLLRAFGFRATSAVLGKVTNFFEGQSYFENCLTSPFLNDLADLHDLLVDAAKQGYTFTPKDWDSFKGETDQITPAYKKAMDASAAAKDSETGVDKTREKMYGYNRENIIDYLYFEVVRSHNNTTMRQMMKILSSTTKADVHLLYPCNSLSDLQDPTINEALRRVRQEMSQLKVAWNTSTHKDDKDTGNGSVARAIEDLYLRYTAIKPDDMDHPTIKSWLHPWLNPDFCLWDRLRASILYAKFPTRSAQTFVFQMAGNELAKIKAERFPATRYIVADIRANMKPKKIKAPVPHEEWDADEDDDDDDDGVSVLEQGVA